MCKIGLPEILLVAPILQQMMTVLINSVCHKMKAGQVFTDWDTSDDIIANFSVNFRELTPEDVTSNCGMLQNIFGKNRRVLQMFVPDADGKFPWHNGCKLPQQLCLGMTYKTQAN